MKVAQIFSREGSDAWFYKKPSELLSEGFRCPECGNQESENFEKGSDIIDVWFESGVSHQAVLRRENGLSYPADLYLEGSDQHRGWFQTSLIAAVGLNDSAPYRNVLTHGFIVDGEGRKMSKSLGNVISPFEIIDKYGADLLRLWVVSRDFTQDLRISHEILRQVVEAYRKIRNTFRFLLSNLYDYNPAEAVPYEELDLIDKWCYLELNRLAQEVVQCYREYDFQGAFRRIYLFTNETLSSLYLDVLKDRLYTFHPDSPERRSSQTVLYRLVSLGARMLAPLAPFTAEDTWRYFRNKDKRDAGFESVHLARLEEDDFKIRDESLSKDFEKLIEVRNLVMKAIEVKREAGEIRSSLEAEVRIKIALDNLYHFLDNYRAILSSWFIVSEVKLQKDSLEQNQGQKLQSGEELAIEIAKSRGGKCPRCWNYAVFEGDVCHRCAQVLNINEAR